MKKPMILFIFLELLIITKEYSYIDIIFQGKCEDKKAKTNACMYNMYNYDDKNHDKYSLFDKCGKGKYCDDEIGCMKGDYERLKIGKSCNYDQDCASKSCKSNKCYAAKENEECNGISCEPGLICYSNTDGKNKCVKLATEGQKVEKTYCMSGLGIDKEGKCAKFGTVADGNELIYDERICNSGLAHYKVDENNNRLYICDSIVDEPVCDKNGLKTEGKWKDGTLIRDGCTFQEDYNGKEIYYNTKYSKLRTTFFSEFLDDYKNLDLEKINSNEKYSSFEYGMKKKAREKLILYEHAPHLKAAGIIDSEGKVVGDKKCEYDFIMKNNFYLHSNFIKLNSIILAMIVLLF